MTEHSNDRPPPAVLPASASPNDLPSPLARLADIPEEEIWLAKQKSKRTRRAYNDHAEKNPVTEVERPAINRRHGTTLAFSKLDAAKLLNAPPEHTVEGLRDRAILSVGPQAGLRRAEIAALAVEDLHQNRGFDSLWVVRKGGRRDSLALHPNTAQRIRAYIAAAGHAEDLDGPMFRPLSHNRKNQEGRRHMDPDAIDRVLRKHAKAIGIGRGYSAHSMRATFVTTALENGCPLEDVQQAAGHSEPGTTKLYDRRGYNPEKSAKLLCDVLSFGSSMPDSESHLSLLLFKGLKLCLKGGSAHAF